MTNAYPSNRMALFRRRTRSGRVLETFPAFAILLSALLVGSAGCGGGARGERDPSAVRPARPSSSAEAAQCPAAPEAANDEPLAAQLLVQDGHSELIRSLAASADGRILASTSLDGTVRVWDTTTGILLRRLALGSYGFNVALDGAGRRLAFRAPEADNLFTAATMVVDLNEGSEPIRAGYIGAFNLSHDGKWLAIGVDLHDAATGEKKRSAELSPGTSGPTAAAFDRSDHRLALALQGEILVLEVPTLRVEQRFPQPGYSSPTSLVYDMAFAESALVVRNGFGPGTIDIIDPATGRRDRSLPGVYSTMAVAGDTIWTVDPTNRVAAFRVATGEELPSPPEGSRKAAALAVSGDGRTLVLASEHNSRGAQQSILVQDTATHQVVRTLRGRSRALSAIAVHPSGKQMLVGYHEGEVERWDLELGSLSGTIRQDHTIVSLDYDPSGEVFAVVSASANVAVGSSKTGQILRQWHNRATFGAFLPNTSKLITLSMDGMIAKWDLTPPHPPLPDKPLRFGEAYAEPKELVVARLDLQVREGKAAVSSDGRWIAVAGAQPHPSQTNERVIVLVDTESGAARWKTKVLVFNADAMSLAFTPDGRRILLSSEEIPPGSPRRDQILPTLRILDAETGAILSSLGQRTTGPLAFRGDTLLIGGSRPVLLDSRSFAAKGELGTSGRALVAAIAHPTDSSFLLGNNSGTTWIQPISRKEPLVTFIATADGEYVAAMPDGVFQSSLDGARNVAWTFSNPLEGFSFEQFSSRFRLPESVRRRLAGEDVPGPGPIRRPPGVVIERPPPPVTSEASVSIQASVSSARRVDRVRVFVDGRSAVDKLVCAEKGELTLDVPIHGGRNRLSVIAYDADGYSSNAKILDVVSTAAGDRPDLWVVSAGVSRYPQMPAAFQLDVADDDARSIAAALGAQAGEGRPFRRLVQKTLLDAEVTVDSVERALSGLSAMRPEDLAVVFLAGHGARLSGEEMVYLTSGAAFNRKSAEENGIGWGRIERRLSEARGRVLLLLDACHSGHLSTELVAPNDLLARDLARSDRAGVLIFAAARGSQYSYEVSGVGGSARSLELLWEERRPQALTMPQEGHGLFTSAVLEALSGAAPDRDRSGAIEVGEFIDYVTERVRGLSMGRQTPWVARREMFGDFVLAPSKR